MILFQLFLKFALPLLQFVDSSQTGFIDQITRIS